MFFILRCEGDFFFFLEKEKDQTYIVEIFFSWEAILSEDWLLSTFLYFYKMLPVIVLWVYIYPT